MSRSKKKRAPALQAVPDETVTVTVCRGCCCGSARKHPDVDHVAQLQRVRDSLGPAARLRVSDCLDACERSNVMVVAPSPAGRRAGARPVWLGDVLDDDTADDVAAWANNGGPGVSAPPNVLDLYAFSPSNRVRRAVND